MQSNHSIRGENLMPYGVLLSDFCGKQIVLLGCFPSSVFSWKKVPYKTLIAKGSYMHTDT